MDTNLYNTLQRIIRRMPKLLGVIIIIITESIAEGRCSMAEHVVSDSRLWRRWLLNDGLYRPCTAMFNTLFGVVDPIRISPAGHDMVALKYAASDSKFWLRSPIPFNGYCPHIWTRVSASSLVPSMYMMYD